jgi:hypothetical protein
MRIKVIIIGISVAYLLYKFISNFIQKRQNSKFIQSLDSAENLDNYIEELYALSGREKTSANKLDKFDQILQEVKKQIEGFSILKQTKINDSSYLIFTRAIVKDKLHGSSLKDEDIYDLDYLISYNQENEELTIKSNLHTNLSDKNLRYDFARIFIEKYRQI